MLPVVRGPTDKTVEDSATYNTQSHLFPPYDTNPLIKPPPAPRPSHHLKIKLLLQACRRQAVVPRIAADPQLFQKIHIQTGEVEQPYKGWRGG